MADLSVGDPAPDFATVDQDGREVSTAGLLGERIVLYFYPKDDTPGCTTQACDLRDHYDRFLATGAKVYGVSADSAAKHAKFRAKYDLPFPLLVDADHAVAEAFGTWVQKSMYGRTYMGMERSTFVIGPDGRLETVMRKVKPKAHAEQLLGALTT